MQKTIAFVEDDDVIRENYADILTIAGFDVTTYRSRIEATKAFDKQLPNLVLLDISLGDERDAGFHLCGHLRHLSETLPIIFLTSHNDEVDKISGMRLGADDYITKDASIDFIVVRIEALFRRLEAQNNVHQEPRANVHHLNFDLNQDCSQAYWKGERLDISLTQFWIISALTQNPGGVKSHSNLMTAAHITVEPNTIVAHVRAIRESFRRIDSSFDCLETVRGLGYRWIEKSTLNN